MSHGTINLPASVGNKVAFDGAGMDATRSFTQQTSGTVYFSFLLNVSALGSLNATGGYFAAFAEGAAGNTTYGGTLWLRSDGAGYDIGLERRTANANAVWTSGTTAINNTVFVVVSYQMVAGTLNDVVKLWINPSVGGTEPAQTLIVTGGAANNDLANVNRLLIRQDSATLTPFVQMDELRVGTTWASVTPSGAAPEINLQGNAVSIVSGDITPDVADHTDFGAVAATSGTLTRTFTIENTGTADLTVGTISFSGTAMADYSVTTAPTSPVTASGNTTFVVTFDPSAVGARDATLSIVNNDGNENPYTFAITGTGTADTATPDWANLQFPATASIDEGNTVTVYAQVNEPGITDAGGQGANLQGWIGYSSANTDPSTGGWTWVAASYFGDTGNNDEYSLALGAGLTPGTYYYASRFQIGTGPYVYGGTGGFWNNDSGVLTVNSNLVDFANIQFPATATITQGGSETIYGQVYEPGVTEAGGQGAGITAWIGTSATNTNPNTVDWTWTPATFNTQSGNNDEYQAAIGSALAPGTYYYASRFQKTGSTEYRYGGTAGNWNNDSGVLTVNAPQEINVQGNAVSIVSGDTTPSAADHTDFGAVALGGNIVRTFTIQNTGGVNLVLDNPAVLLDETDSFTITQQPTSPVAPGGSTTFEVTFTPTATTADTNTVLIGSNDSDEGVYSFAVTGSATIDAPNATVATSVGTTNFIANWDAVAGATGYRLDVATDPSFETIVNTTDLIISEYVEGSSSNKYIEVFNGTGAAVNLANYELRLYANGSATPSNTSALSGSLANNSTIVYRNSAATIYGGAATNLNAVVNYNGDDAVVLYNTLTSSFADIFGRTGEDPGTSWTDGGNTTLDKTLVRNANVTGGITTNPAAGFPTLSTEWTQSNIDVVSNLGSHTYNGVSSFYVTGYNNLNVGNVTSYIVNTNLTANTTYYYRVRAVSGGTSANSNVIAVTTDPTSVTWDGDDWTNIDGPDQDIDAIIEGVYNSDVDGEFTAKSLTINSGSFTVSTGTNVTVVGAVNNTLTAAALVIENNANLIQTDNVDNIGPATVLRDSNPLMRLDYTLWSSPVSGQNLLAFSPATITTRFYVYNPTTDLYNVIAPGSNDFAEGTGYLIRMPDNHPTTPTVWNGDFTGTPHNGDVNLTVANGTFNAVGNPYPSTIDADAFIDANNLTDALYFWRKTNAAPTTAYATYTLAGGAGTDPGPGDPLSLVPNGVIQVGQGFIARATSTTIGFTNAMRIGDNQNQFFRQNIERNRIWLNLTNAEGVFSQTMVAYMTGATQGVDAKIDGLYFNDSQIALTSIVEGNEYAVQGRALPFENTDVVPLGFKAVTAGNYTIGLDHVDGLFAEGQEIYLKDNSDNSTHDLNEGSYTFATEAGVFNNRFEIVYQTTLGTENPTVQANQIVAYKQGQDIVINSGNQTMAGVKIYDLRGRLLVEQNHVNAKEVKLFAGSATQMLVVKVTAQDGSEVTKKVMN
ncbi:choice-of-anchor D domain-containing protein [Flavobacterium caeni]|uniref:choice-of-anchor D domain-containing protein n=1 Tax=Flavobacterium caeni TaxID=490189 RepID=UPI00147EF562|nr:choice-of-anchor D domain-containing protein [Flavobacterium caeni]